MSNQGAYFCQTAQDELTRLLSSFCRYQNHPHPDALWQLQLPDSRRSKRHRSSCGPCRSGKSSGELFFFYCSPHTTCCFVNVEGLCISKLKKNKQVKFWGRTFPLLQCCSGCSCFVWVHSNAFAENGSSCSCHLDEGHFLTFIETLANLNRLAAKKQSFLK